MKEYHEIKEIITNKLGITSIGVYKEWLVKWRADGGTATPEEVELLSPDNVNCRDFWRVCEDLFGTDAICNAVDGNVYTSNMGANRNNLNIASLTGLLSYIESHRHYRCKMIEFGTGLGCVKNYVEVTTSFDYVGFDVNPRIPDVLATDERGYLPVNFVQDAKGTVNIVFSSNVLQHVSEKQRKQFLLDAHTMLSPGGYILINLICVTKDMTPTRYTALYGQFTLIPKVDDIINEMETLGFSLHGTVNRMGYHFGFIAQKKIVGN